MITRRELLKYSAATVGAAATTSCIANATPLSKKALYWEPMGESAVVCELCPFQCVLQDGSTGVCRTRENVKGTLITTAYANPCAVHIDPVEKKPVYHMLPGTTAFSVAIAGCPLRCLNCQNYTISQQFPKDTETSYMPPERVVEEAKRQGCLSIAYTYSEPVVWFEYVLETSRLAKKAGIKNILVSSGYINEAPLKELSEFMDAATIDLKGFSNAMYLKLNSAKLQPVLDAIANAAKFGMWVEVSHLVVPTYTDNMDMIHAMCVWHRKNLGPDVPLHFLRFFPLYKLANLYPTPTDILVKARAIALEQGIKFVYVGNVAEIDSSTYCPSCKKAVIVRDGFTIKKMALKAGKCANCGTAINGLWA